ncbi:MAG: glycosyltransferase [Pseudomonadota bacterium]
MENRQTGRGDKGGELGIIRVAYLFNHSFFLGGGEISLVELIRSVDKRRIDPVALVPAEGEIAEQLRGLRVAVRSCGIPPLRGIPKGAPFVSLFRLARIIRGSGAQLLHVNGSRACLYGGLAGRMLGIPVIWHVRETIRDFFFYDGFLAQLAGTIVCVSRGVQITRFGRFGNRIKNRTVVIYNGVDTRKFKRDQAARQRFREKLCVKDEILFGIVGSILPLKGQDFFLKGLISARQKKPGLPVKVLIIGRPVDFAYNAMIRRLVSDSGLDGHVHFQDYSENIRKVFSGLDVFVLPSTREGFSRSLLEAMSAGLPVLATRIGEIEEAVTDAMNAILVDFNDLEGMACAIIKLTEDERLRSRLAENNRKRAMGNFDLQSHTRSIEGVYSELLSRSP